MVALKCWSIQMKVIYKYTIDPIHLVVPMPKGAMVISAHSQHNKMCVWAIVDPEETELEDITFVILGTGINFDMTDNLRFIDTLYLDNGYLVFHIFEDITAYLKSEEGCEVGDEGEEETHL